MLPAIQIVITLLLLTALATAAWFWAAHPMWAALLVAVAGAWSIWLVMQYLRWARRLGAARRSEQVRENRSNAG